MNSSPLWLLLVLFVAIAAGFFLGRLENRRRRRVRRTGGLNYSFGDQPDHAIDALFSHRNGRDASDPDTVDTHLAMGRLFRKRGELDRATRIHQRMLDNGALPENVREDVELELARDFLAAGLLDRAEHVLLHMVDVGSQHSPLAMRHLMSLYEQERDWHSALAMGERLLPRDSSVGPILAQYCCELADSLRGIDETNPRRRLLRRALMFDPGNARASILKGRLELAAGNHGSALRAFRRLRGQPEYFDMVLDDIQACLDALGRQNEMLDLLLDASLDHPSGVVLSRLIQQLKERGGQEEAHRFLGQYLQRYPSLHGLSEMIALQQTPGAAGEGANQPLDILRAISARLGSDIPRYQCTQCGYKARKLHWQCPGCKSWSTLRTPPNPT